MKTQFRDGLIQLYFKGLVNLTPPSPGIPEVEAEKVEVCSACSAYDWSLLFRPCLP